MKTFECKVCGHIEFKEAPPECLVCGSWSKAFIEKADAVKAIEVPEHPTESEKKHLPQIVVVKECGLIPDGTCTDVHARVGEVEHAMTEEHYIKYLDFYVDYRFVSRVWLSPEVCHPAAALHLNVATGKVTVIENCAVW